MKNLLIDTIKTFPDLKKMGKVSSEDIEKAEADLDLKFSDDFKLFTSEFGAISSDGIELFGVVKSPRLSVVTRTIDKRMSDKFFPKSFYVIEDLGVEDDLMVQNSDGEIYLYSGKGTLTKKNNSLYAYSLNYLITNVTSSGSFYSGLSEILVSKFKKAETIIKKHMNTGASKDDLEKALSILEDFKNSSDPTLIVSIDVVNSFIDYLKNEIKK